MTAPSENAPPGEPEQPAEDPEPDGRDGLGEAETVRGPDEGLPDSD